jgi:hypothetical protein
VKRKTVVKVAIDGSVREAQPDELLIELLKRASSAVPQVCYHTQLGPVQTCDTCMVEANGRLVRACATGVADRMRISTKSAKFPLRLMNKDFQLILSAAAKEQVRMPATQAAFYVNSEELAAGDEEDFSAVLRRIEEVAGITQTLVSQTL